MFRRPPWREKKTVHLTLSIDALERMDFVADKMGLTRSVICDALVRTIPSTQMEDAIEGVLRDDALALMAYRGES